MKIDPVDVWSSTTLSGLLRIVLAYVCGTIGAFLPAFFDEGIGFISIHHSLLLLFPVHLALLPMGNVWPGCLALVWFSCLLWRFIVLLGDGDVLDELIWIFILTYLLGLGVCDDGTFLMALLPVAAFGCFQLWRKFRHLLPSSTG